MIDKNTEAYPFGGNYSGSNQWELYGGMTIRQVYAKTAMLSLLATGLNIYEYDKIAECSYKMADAMIAFENKENK